MKASIQLKYDINSESVNPDQALVTIKAKGYKSNTFKASELDDRLWNKLELTPRIQLVEIEEDEFYEYICDSPEYRLQDVKPLGDIIDGILGKVPNINPTKVSNGFLRYWNGDNRVEDVYYSQEDAIATINAMEKEFLADTLTPVDENGEKLSVDKFALQVARDIGLEAIDAVLHLGEFRYIDGEW